MKKTHDEIFKLLEEEFGSHTKASAAIGYKHKENYRRARNVIGRLPPWRLEKALQLLGLEEKIHEYLDDNEDGKAA